MFNLLLLTITTLLITLSLVQSQSQNSTATCPLDFNVLRNLASGGSKRPPTSDITQQCQYILQGLRLVQSHYLQLSNSFLPPLDSAESCWSTYQVLINEFLPNFNIRSSCGFNTSWISQGCMNISTRSQFEVIVPVSALNDAASNCNQSLENNSPCAACTTSLSTLQARYLTGTSIGNVSDCQAYPSIYAAAFTNRYGPTDKGTAKCLFLIDFTSKKSSKRRSKVLILGVLLGGGVGLLVLIGLFWIFHKRKKRADKFGRVLETELGSGLESISQSTSLVKYTFDEIRKATRNFSRDNIIGRGGYGNVYKGELPDGSLVAFKRFKNCSAAGDSTFTHEVEVIASVRHVNLVALRGYCTATSPFEGHQRIIVCDLIKNGTLYDHLFGSMRDGRTLDVIEDGMPELGSQEILEKYVLVAVLCSHPQLYARPTMDQVVKMLETDLSIPSIPERPIPLVAEMGDIERSLSNCASGQLSSPTGYQHFTFENDRPSICKEERSSSDSIAIE
ncbi:LRR RECEPTOR-LIKE SERINE/THREONINE-PROTEIN KINASE RKF3-RELATED [Salix koriyanagi]|uniref:LRR RECEPTOR-LIKE SERINE/THREONINE-PROTEIN KINASE RKF3-RELATED n=1 Tax=Salix koriyanagi TaxID=2511006 RepID=A0A9Q0U4X3_9ROSI|nr:LRR RECEPTOR-LIKE SERINE/THREONINE-PROTEIN KINASE RKF3-RELATED [Salix koriyanagi]